VKKLLGSTLALVLLVPTMANAELLKNLQIGGSLDVEGVDGNNLTDFNKKNYDELNTVLTRLNVKADWDLLDDVHAHISLDKYDSAWGSNPLNGYNNFQQNAQGTFDAPAGSASGNNNPSASQSVNGVLNSLLVDEAYVKVKGMFGSVDATVGRQFYGDKGDLVAYYGPHDFYGMAVTALDAARLDWQGDKVGVTVIGSKLYAAGQYGNINGNTYYYAGYEGFNPTLSNSYDQTLWGIVANVKPTDNASGAVSLYYRDTVNSGTTAAGGGVAADDMLYVLDLKGKITAGGAWLKAEYAKDFGQDRPDTNTKDQNYDGWAFLLDLGDKVDVNNVGALTGWGQLAVGSGSNGRNSASGIFQGVAGDYRPGDIYGRFFTTGYGYSAGEVTGFNNSNWNNSSVGGLVVIGAGVKVNPASLSKLTVGASWWNFRYQNADTAALVSNGANNGNGFIGNEYDLDATWKQSENVSVTLSGGTFQPGNFIKAVNASNGNKGNNPATLLAADFHLKF